MEPPSFPSGAVQTLRAAPGSAATLSFPLPSGTPPFHYEWNRAGASLDDRFTTSDDAGGVRLTISAARTGDSGVYTLQASNAGGKDAARVRLEVSADEAPTGDDPPTFLRRLQDLTVKVGTRTRFLVEIVSSTECKVTWYRNERRLMEAERVSLVRDGNFWCADVAAVSVDDAGRWTCTAENGGGRASCSAHLNVLVPKAYKRPEFVEELRALLTEQGTVSLECKVVGVPTPVLRWFKDSREIKAGDVFALTANAEDPTSLGTYTCEAVNCMGRAYSSSKVHVVGRGSREGSAKPSTSSVTPEPPPIFTKELEDQFVRICEPLTLSCHIVVPPWPRSVVWYNKEGKVEAGERYHVLEDGVGGYLLEVPAAEFPDEGEWKCVATSPGGRVGISTCYVTMDVPKNYRRPRFMENLQAVLTEEGLVSFECKVVGFPTPVLSWFKDGQELKPGDVYQLTGTNSLGSYCCIAKNCMGHASSSAELTVEDIQNQLNEEEKLRLFSKNQAPKFLQGLKSVEAKIDEPFRFTIKVAIPPEPSVLWYRDDQPVDESSRCHHGKEDKGLFCLEIQSLEFLDQAEWKCVAMNDFGHSVTSCFLKLIIPRHYKKPRFLENLQAIMSEEGAVNLECKVIGVPQPVLKWYKDGEELKPGDIHRIISGQDGTCCLGTYTCEAQNCMGIAASSASLLGFDDSMKAKKKKAEEEALQRNLSLSTIHEERTSQMYDTPVGDITLDDKGEISFSFDGKEVSVSLYETPDLTEEEALQIVEMYADQLSENVTEHNVVELPPLRFVKETSTSGNLLMQAIIIDVSPEYFTSPEEDLRTEADVEDISIADENGPPQLSLDTDLGEDYLEKTMALLSDDKADIPKKIPRRKSDSVRSGDDYFSLSRDQSLSEGKKDDDTQVFSESDVPSFASARSSGKAKTKSTKPSDEDIKEPSDLTKTILIKDEVQKHPAEPDLVPVVKPKRERRTSRSSRRSSSGSEISYNKSKEELKKIETDAPKKPTLTHEEFKIKMSNVGITLSKVMNDVQIIERDIILKSELMSSAATASRSLEIISSLITPLAEIHSIVDVAQESVPEFEEVSSTLFNSLPQSLKALQQSLTIVEKCIDVESDSKTLVKKTCVAFIETCGNDMQKLMSEISSVISKDYLLVEEKTLSEIEFLTSELMNVIKYSSDTIKTRRLLREASEIKADEPSFETKHLRDTQKAVFELRSPLNSLLCIANSADSGKIVDVEKIKSSEVILTDMSASIQDLQVALEQIESLSVKESNSSLHKYNTAIIETVMESVLKLRSSFEQLSTDTKNEEDKATLKKALTSIKHNLGEISLHIDTIEKNIGTFDILQSDNKLEVLQKMAQILIALENNLPRLEIIPEVKKHMDVFHKNLTKVLENVIESNDARKYFTLIEICDAVNRVNTSIKQMDSDNVLFLASLSNTLRIIQDHFIHNVFESELNCSILSNITDVLINVQEALNHAEEIIMQIESEQVQEISTQTFEETKAKVIIEHIEQTIASITNVKSLETTENLNVVLIPALENICPILEEIKRSIASVRPSGVENEEHVSEMSDHSLVQTLATPMCELNQNIVVLNQLIVENVESIKENSAVMATIAEPLHELHTTLEVLQQDVISQYEEDVKSYDVSGNMASALQSLQSCIVMVQEQAGVEAADDMSTLEDISGIKTTADIIPSDRLVLPAAEEIAIEQSLDLLNQELATTATAQALQTLNEYITVLQSPEILDALDTLSEVSDYSSLKSVALGLGELNTGIQEILHPFIMESSNEINNFVNTSKLTAIAEPMQELQQSLSVLDISNIPIYEHILEIPTERIHSVLQSISEFKEHLSKCIHAVFPAMETADKTIEISNKVEALRDVCEHLKYIIENAKSSSRAPVKLEVIILEETVNNLLDATDVSKGIKIDQVKFITEELYQNILTVQEEIIQFTSQTSEKLSEEAKLIQVLDEIESNIAVLEQYEFVDLSRVSDITSCTSPQLAIDLESESLMQMEDIVENAVNIVQDSKETPIADLMIIEDFFKTCRNEFTILRCLMTKQPSYKKIIRLLQEFSALKSTINEFKGKKTELKISDDIAGYLSNFLIQADECIKSIQNTLIKLVDSQSEVLFETQFKKLENTTVVLQEIDLSKQSSEVKGVLKQFADIIEVAKPCVKKAESSIIEELKDSSTDTLRADEKVLVQKIDEFSAYIEYQTNTESIDKESKQILEKVLTCIQKHEDYKDAIGTGKSLIIFKCLSECSDVFQQKVLESKVHDLVDHHKLEESALKTVLSEMLEPLQALHNQLVNVQEQILSGADEESMSVDITSTESLVQTMTEIHKEIIQQVELETSLVNNEEISLIMEVDKEIHSIQDSIRSMENVQGAQAVIKLSKPIENIEQSLHNILSSEKVSVKRKGKLAPEQAKELMQHIDQYIELIEIVEEITAIIKIDDLKETVTIAKELRESITATETCIDADTSDTLWNEIAVKQTRLAHQLQKAISALQVQVLDCVQELAPALGAGVLQRIVKVTIQLQADLVAVTGIQVAVEAPANFVDEVTKLIDELESRVQATITVDPEHAAVSEGLNQMILEEVIAEEKLVISSEKAVPTIDTIEMLAAESKQMTTDEDFKPEYNQNETIKILTTEQLLSTESAVSTFDEQTEVLEEKVKAEDVYATGKNDDMVMATLSQISMLSAPSSTEEQQAAKTITVSEHVRPGLLEDVLITEMEKVSSAQQLKVNETLMQHIEQYISQEVVEIIEKLSVPANIQELQQSVTVARKLHETFAAANVGTGAEAEVGAKDGAGVEGGSTLQLELRAQQAQLVQQLYSALSTLQVVALHSEHELASTVGKNALQHIVHVATQLQDDLAAVVAIAQVAVHHEPAKQIDEITEVHLIKGAQGLSATVPDTVSQPVGLNEISQSSTVIDLITQENIIEEKPTETIESIEGLATSNEVVTMEDTISDDKDVNEFLAVTKQIIAYEISQPVSIEEVIALEENLTFQGKVVVETAEVLTVTTLDDPTARNSSETIACEEIISAAIEKVALSQDTGPSPTEGVVIIDKADIIDTERTKITKQGDLIHHIEEFISNQISEIVEELSNLTNTEELKRSVTIAKELRESIGAIDTKIYSEVTTPLENKVQVEQAKLAQKLHDALSTLQTQVLDSAQEIALTISPECMQRVSDVVTHLQDDLKVAIAHTAEEVKTVPTESLEITEENSMKQLEALLQEVSDKINISSAERRTEDTDELRDTLDEVQTVIIKLKRDCDGAVDDTLNETLEDLECSVRSVQLQINEDSPPDLLKEACATLLLLANNMNETQEVHVSETISKNVKIDNILEQCSLEAEKTVKLLETASKVDTRDSSNLNNIVFNLNNLKDTLKLLRLSFLGDAGTLIEKGIDVVQRLGQIEDKVFSLERDIDSEQNLTPVIKDNIISAVHSVYGSISNMRSTIASIQKQYLYENYGRPSERLLRSIKNVSSISKVENEDVKKSNWKQFSKSLRNVLNHFEDIKFYVNLDKTARLPSDATFTKIILEELKYNINDTILPQTYKLGSVVSETIQIALKCIQTNLINIESRSTLEVREKIPMFKEIATQMSILTDSLLVGLENIIENKISEENPDNLQIEKKNVDNSNENENKSPGKESKAYTTASEFKDEEVHKTLKIVKDVDQENLEKLIDDNEIPLITEEAGTTPAYKTYIQENDGAVPSTSKEISDINQKNAPLDNKERTDMSGNHLDDISIKPSTSKYVTELKDGEKPELLIESHIIERMKVGEKSSEIKKNVSDSSEIEKVPETLYFGIDENKSDEQMHQDQETRMQVDDICLEKEKGITMEEEGHITMAQLEQEKQANNREKEESRQLKEKEKETGDIDKEKIKSETVNESLESLESEQKIEKTSLQAEQSEIVAELHKKDAENVQLYTETQEKATIMQQDVEKKVMEQDKKINEVETQKENEAKQKKKIEDSEESKKQEAHLTRHDKERCDEKERETVHKLKEDCGENKLQLEKLETKNEHREEDMQNFEENRPKKVNEADNANIENNINATSEKEPTEEKLQQKEKASKISKQETEQKQEGEARLEKDVAVEKRLEAEKQESYEKCKEEERHKQEEEINNKRKEAEKLKIEQDKLETENKRKEENKKIEEDRLKEEMVDAENFDFNKKNKGANKIQKEEEKRLRKENEEKEKAQQEAKLKQEDENQRLETDRDDAEKLEKERQEEEVHHQEEIRKQTEDQDKTKLEQDKIEDDKRIKEEQKLKVDNDRLNKEKEEAEKEPLDKEKKEAKKILKEERRLLNEKEETERVKQEIEEKQIEDESKLEKERENAEKARVENEKRSADGMRQKAEIHLLERNKEAEKLKLEQEKLEAENKRIEEQKRKLEVDRLKKENDKAEKVKLDKENEEANKKQKEEEERLQTKKEEAQKSQREAKQNQEDENARLEKERNDAEKLEIERQAAEMKIQENQQKDQLKLKEDRLNKEKEEAEKVKLDEEKNETKEKQMEEKKHLLKRKEETKIEKQETAEEKAAHLEKEENVEKERIADEKKEADKKRQEEENHRQDVEKKLKLEQEKLEAENKQKEKENENNIKMEQEKHNADKKMKEAEKQLKLEQEKLEAENKQKEEHKLEEDRLNKEKEEAEKIKLDKEMIEEKRLQLEEEEAQKSQKELKQRQDDENARLEKQKQDAEKARLEIKEQEADKKQQEEKKRIKQLKTNEDNIKIEQEKHNTDKKIKEAEKQLKLEQEKLEAENKQKEEQKHKLEEDCLNKEKEKVEQIKMDMEKKEEKRLQMENEEAEKTQKELKQRQDDENARLEKARQDAEKARLEIEKQEADQKQQEENRQQEEKIRIKLLKENEDNIKMEQDKHNADKKIKEAEKQLKLEQEKLEAENKQKQEQKHKLDEDRLNKEKEKTEKIKLDMEKKEEKRLQMENEEAQKIQKDLKQRQDDENARQEKERQDAEKARLEMEKQEADQKHQEENRQQEEKVRLKLLKENEEMMKTEHEKLDADKKIKEEKQKLEVDRLNKEMEKAKKIKLDNVKKEEKRIQMMKEEADKAQKELKQRHDDENVRLEKERKDAEKARLEIEKQGVDQRQQEEKCLKESEDKNKIELEKINTDTKIREEENKKLEADHLNKQKEQSDKVKLDEEKKEAKKKLNEDDKLLHKENEKVEILQQDTVLKQDDDLMRLEKKRDDVKREKLEAERQEADKKRQEDEKRQQEEKEIINRQKDVENEAKLEQDKLDTDKKIKKEEKQNLEEDGLNKEKKEAKRDGENKEDKKNQKEVEAEKAKQEAEQKQKEDNARLEKERNDNKAKLEREKHETDKKRQVEEIRNKEHQAINKEKEEVENAKSNVKEETVKKKFDKGKKEVKKKQKEEEIRLQTKHEEAENIKPNIDIKQNEKGAGKVKKENEFSKMHEAEEVLFEKMDQEIKQELLKKENCEQEDVDSMNRKLKENSEKLKAGKEKKLFKKVRDEEETSLKMKKDDNDSINTNDKLIDGECAPENYHKSNIHIVKENGEQIQDRLKLSDKRKQERRCEDVQLDHRENIFDTPPTLPEIKHHMRDDYESTTSRHKLEDKDKPRFIDHDFRDLTMEFARPSGYTERSFDNRSNSVIDRDGIGRSAVIYKAHTIVLDSQLRSSLPPLPDITRSSECERRSEVRLRSKGVSEARSILSEKRSSVPRDIKRKPVFSTYLTDRTAVAGSRVKLTCSVLSSSDPTVTWYKNGVVLADKLKFRTKFLDGLITLEVLNAAPCDSAEYSCTVENENGSVNSSANLKVYPSFEASPIPPTFTRSIRDTYHIAENELILECRIRGQPLPTITWMKDDKPVNNSDRCHAYYLADGLCRLAISSPTPDDSGKYSCKAESSVWSDQITHVVNFTGKESRLSPNLATIERSRFNRQIMESRRPHFTNVLTDYKVTKGGTIGLQVEIRGSPTRVEWLREGRSVTESYRNARTFVEQELYTLALTDVTERESGTYTCRAWSSHGTVDMNAAITVVHPNEIEGKPAIIVGRPEKDVLISVGEDLNISFRVQGEPKPKVVFMKGIRDITNSQRVCKMTSDDYVKFTLKRSVVSDAGTYCIYARNAYGCDRAFVTVVVRQRASSENLISDWTYPADESALSIAERYYKSVPDRIPAEPTLVDGGNNWVSLVWPKPDPRTKAPVLAYKVESWLLGKEGGARWVELGITPLNSFDAFNLKQGEEYHFRVTPRNRYGWGESVQTSSPIGIGLAGDTPEFVDILPGQLKVLLGETASLSCSVKGKPLPEVVWMKNGHEIEEEDRRLMTSFNGYNCCLIIKGVNIEDEARYSCEATNVHGRASTYARLAVVTDRLIWEADAKLKRERSADVDGDYPPQFTMRLRDRRVQATYPVRLTCQVVGSPAPTVTWYKDGEEVEMDSRHNTYRDEHFHTIEIAPTTLEDGGIYEAMARNHSGAISCRCCLVVDKGIRAYVAPEFCCGLEPLYRLSEGEELRISAVVEAYPSVGVTWYRDGVRLRPSRRTIMTLDRDGQIELALAFMTPRDGGVYTCTASNEVGRASTSGKVEVIEGDERVKKKTPPMVVNPNVPYSKEPMFIRKPRSSEAREGDTVIIECEVIGDPKPDVYWLRDFLKPDYYRDATHFKRVGAGPEYRFEIPHAKLDYTGTYSVVARNAHGEAKAIISLQILAKDPSSSEEHNVRYGRVEVLPRFERDLTDLLSYDGDAIEFECRVSGNPAPDIRWFHYTELIRECPDFETTFAEGTARLKIKQVTPEDEGTYCCEASNCLGKATSNACLVVYPPGEPNTLSQRLRRPPAFLSAASTPRSTPRSTPVRSVSRTPGPDARRLCSPSRQIAPKFYTYPFNKVVEEGEHVVIQCAVKGLPNPWATWDKDGVIVTPSSRITIKEKDEMLRILEIEQVTIEDVGLYRITLENDFGRVEASARLEVITQKGKFYAGVRGYSPSPRRALGYRKRLPSASRQD